MHISSNVIIFIWMKMCTSHFSDNENAMILSLIQHLRYPNCILADKSDDISVQRTAKYLTQKQVYTVLVEPEKVMDFLFPDGSWYVHVKYGICPSRTAVVWKTDLKSFEIEFNKLHRELQELKSLYTWVIIVESQTFSLNAMSNLYIPYDCHFLLAVSDDEQTYHINEVYKIRNRSRSFRKHFATWDTKNGLEALDPYFYARRLDFESFQLLLFLDGNEPCLSKVLCRQLELWYELGRMLNFTTYEITWEETQFYRIRSSIEENSTIIDARLNLMPFNFLVILKKTLAPMWTFKTYMHIQYDSDALTGKEGLLRPFSKDVWVCVSVWLFISTFSVVAIEFMSIKTQEKKQSRAFHFVESGFTSFEFLLNQGGNDPLKNASSRMAYLSLWIKVLIIVPAYTGAVVAFLTLQVPHLPFKDLDSFIEVGKYKFIAVNNTFPKRYFELTKDTDPVSKRIDEEFFVDPSEMPNHIPKVLEKVCENKSLVALAYNNEAFDDHIKNVPCRILKVPKPIFSTHTLMYLSDFSPLAQIFKKNLILFRSSGVFGKMEKEAFSYGQEAVEEEFAPIEILSLWPAMSLGFVGIVAAVVFLLCELLVRRRSNR